MAMTIDYIISGDPEQAKAVIREALASQGFGVEVEPSGRWSVARGSKKATMFLGALAGKKQRFAYGLYFYDHNGQLLARPMRETGSGAMGGAIGVARANNVFTEVDQAVGELLTQRGILVSSTRQD
ncbi:hypothetical protein [Paramicrobacterium fandaimingii]|uniref:hypothetical protein n=1 Tax=Paramicrobacterium fandaimingii TaxID=2708079 RepID=UPI001420C401|nr:hypothetical protein [Microbacterium fandaimingii]